MRNKLCYCLKILFLFIFIFIGVDDVDAYTTGTFNTVGGTRTYLHYCNSSGACSNSSSYTVYYKTINGNVAYCMQLSKKIPVNSSDKIYDLRTDWWNPIGYNALLAAQIVNVGRKLNVSDQYKYLYIQEALNCAFKLDGSYLGACTDPADINIINSAKANLATYDYSYGSSTSNLPNINFSTSNRLLHHKSSGVYLSDEISLNGFVASYGNSEYESKKVTYKLSAQSSKGTAYICNTSTTDSSKCYNGSYTFPAGTSGEQKIYILVTGNSNNESGNVTLTVEGSNESAYPTTYYWVSRAYYAQNLVTYSGNGATVARNVKNTYTLTFNGVRGYSASLEKVNEVGNSLSGSELTLYTASDENGNNNKKEICKISGDKSSCFKSNLLEDGSDGFGYTNGRYLCYSETKAAPGYKLINLEEGKSGICTKINFTAGSNVIYLKVKDGVTADSNEEEYNYYQSHKKYCNVKESNIDEGYINTVILNGLEDNSELIEGTCSDNNDFKSSFDFTKTICLDGESKYDSSGSSCIKNEENQEPTGKNYCIGQKVDSKLIDKECGSLTGDNYIGHSSVCVNTDNNKVTTIDNKYCDDDGVSVTKFTPSSGSYILTVSNTPTVVNISKKAITGSDEVPGAILEVLTTDSKGKCTDTRAKSIGFSYQPFVYKPDDKIDNEQSSKEGEFDYTNSSSSDVKMDYGEEKSLEILDESYDILKDGLMWQSSYAPAIITGLPKGTYCLKETLAPKGYKIASSVTKFSIDDYGNVKLVDNGNKMSDYNKDSNTLSVHDDLITISISKQDMATSKELPGAQISICLAGKNADNEYVLITDYLGNCTSATLADGSSATWISGDKPHEVKGLGSGTYYLVERVAPEGYQEAEKILFTVDEEGNIFDANGTSIKDSKLVMKDKKTENIKSGNITIALLIMVAIISLGYIIYTENNKKSII